MLHNDLPTLAAKEAATDLFSVPAAGYRISVDIEDRSSINENEAVVKE